MMTMEVHHLPETMREVVRLVDSAEKQAAAELLREGEELMAESQEEVPRRTGDLARSRFVILEGSLPDVEVRVGYTASYAVPVHERPLNYRVGKWKYLEDPFQRRAAGMDARIAKRIRLL